MNKQSLMQRWDGYQASKTVAVWLCLGSMAATLVVGFGWGGWVTGGTARNMESKAATDARAELAAAICVQQFVSGTDARAQMTALKAADSWTREGLLEKGGWVTLPGVEKPVEGAAALCSQRLVDLPEKAAKSG